MSCERHGGSGLAADCTCMELEHDGYDCDTCDDPDCHGCEAPTTETLTRWLVEARAGAREGALFELPSAEMVRVLVELLDFRRELAESERVPEAAR